MTHDNSSDDANVGARLREERQRIGLSVAALASAGGVNRNSQGEYEAGKRPFTSAYLSAISGEGVDPLYILTGRRTPPAHPQDDLALVTMRVALPPREALQRMYEAILLVYHDLHGVELAQALARHLPSGLAQLAGPLVIEHRPDESDRAAADNLPADRPARRQEQRR